jgi:hypothetical protein
MKATPNYHELSSKLPDNSGVPLAELPDQQDADIAAQHGLREVPGLVATPRADSLFSSTI